MFHAMFYLNKIKQLIPALKRFSVLKKYVRYAEFSGFVGSSKKKRLVFFFSDVQKWMLSFLLHMLYFNTINGEKTKKFWLHLLLFFNLINCTHPSQESVTILCRKRRLANDNSQICKFNMGRRSGDKDITGK